MEPSAEQDHQWDEVTILKTGATVLYQKPCDSLKIDVSEEILSTLSLDLGYEHKAEWFKYSKPVLVKILNANHFE